MAAYAGPSIPVELHATIFEGFDFLVWKAIVIEGTGIGVVFSKGS